MSKIQLPAPEVSNVSKPSNDSLFLKETLVERLSGSLLGLCDPWISENVSGSTNVGLGLLYWLPT